MKLFTVNTKAQYLAEYVLIISLVTVALMAISVYVRRGLQGRYRDATDGMVSALQAAGGVGGASQYEPYYFKFDITNTLDSERTREFSLGGLINGTFDTMNTRKGTQWILPKELE